MLLSSPVRLAPSRSEKLQRLSRRNRAEKRRKAKTQWLFTNMCFLPGRTCRSSRSMRLSNSTRASSPRTAASVGRVENWGLKSLTYRVNKNRKAYYTLMDLDLPAGRAQRDGAPDGPLRRRPALPDHQGREARGRPVGNDAEARRAQRPSARDGDRDRGPRGGFGDRGPRPRSFGDRDDRVRAVRAKTR